MKEKKIWGEVTHIFADTQASISVLSIEKGSRCSIHRHKERVNHFIVTSGEVVIHTFGSGDIPTPHPMYSRYLKPGETYTIGTGIWHQFAVIVSGRMIEVYWPADEFAVVHKDDIIRHCEGSKDGT